MSSPDTVTVIIVTCNSLPSVLSCLKRLAESSSSVSEVVVVDNASTDKTVVAIRRDFPNHLIIENEVNFGFARACNQAAEIATGEYLLFINPDLDIDPETVGTLLSVARATKNAGLVAGRLRYPDGSFQANCRQFPTITNLFFSRGSIFGRLFLHHPSLRSEVYSLPDYDDVTAVPAVSATLTLIRRRTFKKMHGFDRRFFLYMEDTDLSLRLHNSGFTNLFVPNAGGVHGFSAGSQMGKFRRSMHHHQSVWKYFLKHHPNGFSLFLLPVFLTANLLVSAFIPRQGRE